MFRDQLLDLKVRGRGWWGVKGKSSGGQDTSREGVEHWTSDPHTIRQALHDAFCMS